MFETKFLILTILLQLPYVSTFQLGKSIWSTLNNTVAQQKKNEKRDVGEGKKELG